MARSPSWLIRVVRRSKLAAMFTIFHLLELMGMVFGIVAGAAAGRMWFGWLGLVLGGVAGFFLGGVLGRLPYAIASAILNRNLKRCDTQALRSRLEREYYISHLIIALLLSRGESVGSFREYVAGLRRSDSPDRRRFGDRLLQIWPEFELPSDSTSTQKGQNT